MTAPVRLRRSWLEASARERVTGLCDPGTLVEWCAPAERHVSPHLAALGLPQAFDDGIVVGEASLQGHRVLVAAQEGRFNGGAVGEVHGAKLTGLLQVALQRPPAAVLLLVDSGGVRLHEANAGILAISEIARALLDVRAAGIPVLVLLGGSCGAFGGMGIVTRLAHGVVMSEEARLSLSGPEVIETVKGREEFDSRDRPLVWRVTGGKVRRVLGEAQQLVADDIAAFRAAAAGWIECSLAAPGGRAPGMATAEDRALAAQQLTRQQQDWLYRADRLHGLRDGAELLQALPGLQGDPALVEAAAFEDLVRAAQAAGWHAAPAQPGAAAAAGGGAVALPPEVRALGTSTGLQALQADLPLDDEDQAFADQLFGPGQHALRQRGHFLAGTAQCAGRPVSVVGTRDRAPIGLALALAMADAVLQVVAADQDATSRRPILLLADTQGQALSRHEELLGLNGALAHLARCVDLARRAGHALVTLVRHEAVSGGFLSFGMLGDLQVALPEAQVRVMDLRAMARVTRLPLERLESLATTSAIFAPGAQPFYQLGGLHALWSAQDDWPASLAAALQTAAAGQGVDARAQLGAARGGRTLAAEVAQRVRRQAGCAT